MNTCYYGPNVSFHCWSAGLEIPECWSVKLSVGYTNQFIYIPASTAVVNDKVSSLSIFVYRLHVNCNICLYVFHRYILYLICITYLPFTYCRSIQYQYVFPIYRVHRILTQNGMFLHMLDILLWLYL